MSNDKFPADVPRDPVATRDLGSRSVVLLRSTTWPQGLGVCCWRSSVAIVFGELDLQVHQLVGTTPEEASARRSSPDSSPGGQSAEDSSATSGGVQPRLRLSRSVPTSLEGPYETSRRVVRRAASVGRSRADQLVRVAGRRWGLGGRSSPLGRYAPGREDRGGEPGEAGGPNEAGELASTRWDARLEGLAGARLVVVESPRDAIAAVEAGVPRASVWLLAVPAERITAGEPAVGWAGPLRDAAPCLGGLLTDSTDAAGILERIVGPIRTVVFPPVAVDGCCPTCGSGAARGDGTGGDGTDVDPYPRDVPGHLRLWRQLLVDAADQPIGALPLPYSYAVARVLGHDMRCAADRLTSWAGTLPAAGQPGSLGSSTSKDCPGCPPASSEASWTRDVQRVGARRVLASLPPVPAEPPETQRPVRVFGSDLRFMRDLTGILDGRGDLDVVVDEWPSSEAPNGGDSERLAREGQTLVAEWCSANAVWLSRVKRPGQHLVVRLHRLEVEAADPREVDITAVDTVVYVSPHMGRRIRAELGWPAEKLVYVPLYVDLPQFDRPKHPGARFTLGMVGMMPSRKRFELALELLATVRRDDPRFTLLVRSQPAWAHPSARQHPAERRYFQHCLERIEKDPLLRGAVVFDSYGNDMAAWFRKIGQVLSLSDAESFHAGLAEGMGSGAVPILRGWPGAAELYGEHWIRGSVTDAASDVLANADSDVWQARAERAKGEVRWHFDPAAVVAAWVDLAQGRHEDARKRFPQGLRTW